jgi:hypothetical protein
VRVAALPMLLVLPLRLQIERDQHYRQRKS